MKPLDPEQLAQVTGGLKATVPTGERTSPPRNPIPDALRPRPF